MMYKEALRDIEPILNSLEESAYQQGHDDCEAEMESKIAKARDEGYEQGYQECLVREKE